MSITRGIEIRRKDPAKDRPSHERPDVGWKNLILDTWVSEWMFKYMPKKQPYEIQGEYWSCIIEKEELLKMADDLMNRRFEVCPDTHDWFKVDEHLKDLFQRYGECFKDLSERLQDDEMLIFYDGGC